MPRVRKVVHSDGSLAGHAVQCPACGYDHFFNDPSSPHDGHSWQFNGDLERPTFTPSMNVLLPSKDNGGWETHCHSFVTDGRIQFLGDCKHKMAGQTVDLPEID